MHTKHECNRGCGGYLHGDFFGIQDKNKMYFNKIVLMNHMCQKFVANIGKTEVTYKPHMNTKDEELYSKEEEDIKNRPRHNLCLNIRSTSPSPVRQ